MTDILPYLQQVRTKLTPAGSWTKGTCARDAKRKPVPACNPEAVMWCIVGAINTLTDDMVLSGRILHAIGLVAAERLAARGERYIGMPMYNDDPKTTHREVLEVLDETIKRESEKAYA